MKAVGMSRNRIAFIISNTTRHLALLRLADSLPATLHKSCLDSEQIFVYRNRPGSRRIFIGLL